LIVDDATAEAVVDAFNADKPHEARITSLATALYNYALAHPTFLEELGRLLEKAVMVDREAYRTRGDSHREAEALGILGLLYTESDRQHEAVEMFNAVLMLARTHGGPGTTS
jgi:cytochrome c-type biogenesis protein CcmH/NrfG